MDQQETYEKLRSLLQRNSCPPFVLTGAIDHWPAKNWTVDFLAETFPEKSFRCRLTPREKESSGPAWESDSVYVNCTLHQFSEWSQGGDDSGDDNPLCPFPPEQFSAYIDYRHMVQVFEDCPDMLEDVRWSDLGLEGIDGTKSTLWIGSPGASTPCHYDSYGFNLVAQIQGRKRWVLFAPEDSSCLYPTRIPYEESSVFSQVDVEAPDLTRFPLFQKSRPYVVTLEPGQALFVPRHWWHHVSCTETAISINTWVDVPEDAEIRVHESVTRCLASAFIPYLAETARASSLEEWINPTEDIEPATTNVAYLTQAFHQLPSSKTVNASEPLEQDPSQLQQPRSSSTGGEQLEQTSTQSSLSLCSVSDSGDGNCETFQAHTLQKKRNLEEDSEMRIGKCVRTSCQRKSPSSNLQSEDFEVQREESCDECAADSEAVEVRLQCSSVDPEAAQGSSESCSRILQLASSLKDFEIYFQTTVEEGDSSKSSKGKVFVLYPCTFSEFLQTCCLAEDAVSEHREHPSIQEAFLRSLLDPDVIKMIVGKMQEQLKKS